MNKKQNMMIFLIFLISFTIIILFLHNKNFRSENYQPKKIPDIKIEGKIKISLIEKPFTKKVKNGRLFGFICPENTEPSDCGVIIDTGSQYFFYKINKCNKNQKIMKYNYGIGALTYQKRTENIKYYNNNTPKYLKNINLGNICKIYGGNLTNILGINYIGNDKQNLPIPFIKQIDKRFITWISYPKNGNNNYANISLTSNMPSIPLSIKDNIEMIEMKTLNNKGWIIKNDKMLNIDGNLVPIGSLLFDTGTTYGVAIHFPSNQYKKNEIKVIENLSLKINNKELKIVSNQGMVIQYTKSNLPIYILGLPVLIEMMYGMIYDKEEGKLYMIARKNLVS